MSSNITLAAQRLRLRRNEVKSMPLSVDWLTALRRYIIVVAIANLLWEFAHIPLYTIATTGTVNEIIFAAVHCTGGDVLIALSCIFLALFLAGDQSWPTKRPRTVATLSILFGVVYTKFSEWLNVSVRKAWAYSDLMPVIPFTETGLSPVLQWIVIPLVGFWWALRSPKPQEFEE